MMRTRLTKVLALILALVMTIGLLPMSAMATETDNGLELSKTLENNGAPDTNGVYWLDLEAYTTGTVGASSTKPLDIVLVLDVSGSMNESFGYKTVEAVNNEDLYELPYDLYVKIGDEYKKVKVKVKRTWDSDTYSDVYTYSYVKGNNKITATSSDTYTWNDTSHDWQIESYGAIPEWTFYTSESKLDALKAAANGFVDMVHTNAATNNVVHKISVVSFANPGTATAKIGLTNVQGDDGATNVKTVINNLSANGGTYIDEGLTKAREQFSTADEDRNPQRIVVVFTDGIPGTGRWDDSASMNTANNAISIANSLKNTDGAKVFTIGILDGSDPTADFSGNNDTQRSNRMLHYISSNYLGATSMSNGGNGSNAGYYKAASNASQLDTVFQTIAGSISSSIELDDTAVVKDVVADPFQLAVNATSGYPITVSVSQKTATGWAASAPATGVIATPSNGTVDVTGFDFNANCVTTSAKSDGRYGAKLIIRIPIALKNGATMPTGVTGDQVYTNDPASGVYKNSSSTEPIEPFERPQTTLYTVTFKDAGDQGAVLKTQVVIPGGNATAPADPTRSGFTFTGWDKTFNNIQTDTVVTATYEQTVYNVKYDAGTGATWTNHDGTATAGSDYTVVSDTPTKTGYTFTGWTTSDVNTSATTYQAGETFKMPSKDVTLTATWTSTEYTITYDLDSGALETGKTNPATYTVTSDAITLNNPVKTGYTFLGWSGTGLTGSANTSVTIPTGSTGNRTYTAHWLINSYTVTWVDENGTTKLGTHDFNYGTSATDVAKEQPNNPTKAADNTYTYTFNGWTPTYETVTSNKTYTATYTKTYIDYTVKFVNYNGDEISTTTYHYGDTVTIPSNPTRPSDSSYTYTFSGWDKTVATTVTGNATYKATYGSTQVHYNHYDDITTDIPTGLNGIDHIAYIIGRQGYARPEAPITRAEVASIFFRLLTDEMRETYLTSESSFSDVHKGEWYNTMVDTLAEMGIINGYPDGTFRPNAYITRAEFAAIAARFDSTDITGKTATFSDIATSWAKDEIVRTTVLGWTNGYPDGTFRPQNNITRAEVATLVNRVLQRVPGKTEDLLADMVKWPDNLDTTKWYYLAIQEASNTHDYEKYTGDDKTTEYEKWTKLRENPDWTQYQK
jgi:uncharacterized repeat protein (TIGR02543 family)